MDMLEDAKLPPASVEHHLTPCIEALQTAGLEADAQILIDLPPYDPYIPKQIFLSANEKRELDAVDEEIAFIREDRAEPTKKVQVKWSGEAARWYPIAIKILKDLVLANNPVEFATELLMPYTLPKVREHHDPYAYVASLKEGE